MNQPPEEDAVDRVILSALVRNERNRAKTWLIFYTQDAENAPSERNEGPNEQSDPRSNPAKPFVAKGFHANNRKRLEWRIKEDCRYVASRTKY